MACRPAIRSVQLASCAVLLSLLGLSFLFVTAKADSSNNSNKHFLTQIKSPTKSARVQSHMKVTDIYDTKGPPARTPMLNSSTSQTTECRVVTSSDIHSPQILIYNCITWWAVCRNNNHNSATKMLPQKRALSFPILFAMFKQAPDILNQRDIVFPSTQ